MEDLIRDFNTFKVSAPNEYDNLKHLLMKMNEPNIDNHIYAKAKYYLREICFDMNHPEYVGVDEEFKTTVKKIENYLQSCMVEYHWGNQVMGRQYFQMAANMILNFFK
jgi:hypothetical protein